MSSLLLEEKYKVDQNDFVSAGEASASIKRTLKKIGINPAVIRKVSIATYEAEINIIIHSYGGYIYLTVTDEDITVICKDTGPGINDVDMAMQEGFSTASEEVRNMGFGAGMGLPNMNKNASDFSVESSPEGTTISMKFSI